MSDPIESDSAQLALQARIRELERELQERRQAEELSRHNETLYRRLAANLPSAAVFLVDHDLRYLIADGEALEQLGLNSASLVGKTIQEALDAATAARFEPLFRKVLSGETAVWEHHSRGREYINHGVPVRDDMGTVVAALALSYDITGQKHTERALAESEHRQREIARLLELDQARLAAVLRHMPVGIWITDSNGRIIGSNEAADRIWAGAPPLSNSIAEYQAYAAWRAGSEKQLEPGEHPLAVALQTGKPVESLELDIQRFDGSQGTVLASAAPIRDPQGGVAGVVGVNVDITERKRLEESVHESELRFRTMADGTPIMIWVTDASGKMEFINKAYTEFFGVSLARIQSGGWQVLLHPEEQAGYVDAYMASVKDQCMFQSEARVLRRDGQWRWVASYGQPRFSERGEFLGMAGSSLDITDRVQAEQALRESEAKFHSAFENAAIGYTLQNPQGRFIDVNTAYCRLTGYSIAELRQLKFSDMLHPEDYDKHVELVHQLLAGDIPDFVVESRYFCKDGKTVWVRKSCSVVREPDGSPKWMLALIEDITEGKQAERARHQNENIYRAIGEAIPYGIWICEPDGRNIYASQSYLDLVGITQQQCSDFGWGDTLHPDDAERTIAAWKECVRTEGMWDIEHRFRGTDGKYHPILARGIPVRDEQGKVICWAGINLDISRLKEVEHNLKTSEERFEVALRNSPMLVYTTDRDLRYTWIYNPPLGMESSEIVGRTDEELDEPANVGELVALKRTVLKTGIGKRTEIAWRYREGIYHYDVTAEPIRDENGSIVGLTVAAVDITDKKRMEQVLLEDRIRIELQRRLLEQREQERLAVAQDIHDGPTQTLAGALLNLDIIRESCGDAALQGELDGIESNVRGAVQELRDIIAELRPALLQQLGLSRAMRAYAEDFHGRYPETGLIQEIEDDLERLSEDACLSLFRIYQEALSNVGHHAAATQARVRFSFRDGAAVLEIEDNGQGMEVLPDLMGQTAKGHYGMAGMQERAEAVGGTLELRSDPGKGTRVRATIPLG
ncbi:MAG TPA: PAS domain S-box protein [Anaerolineales bacterium]|nr:PAS domain S-box protein [Anaerolineales bacterium]